MTYVNKFLQTQYSCLEVLIMALLFMLLIEALPNMIHVWSECEKWFDAIYTSIINTGILIVSLFGVMKRNSTIVLMLASLSLFVVIFEILAFIRDNTISADNIDFPDTCRMDKNKHFLYGVALLITYVALCALGFALGIKLYNQRGEDRENTSSSEKSYNDGRQSDV